MNPGYPERFSATRLYHPVVMVQRDPETGQFVSDDGEQMNLSTYADMEHFWKRYLLTQKAGGGGTLLDQRELATENAPPDGLDSNEVAELVTADIYAFIFQRDNSSSSSTGSGEARLALGFNMSGTEAPVMISDTDVENEPFGGSSTTASGAVSLGDTVDDPGIIYGNYLNINESFDDTASGAAGVGPGMALDHHRINFRDDYGVGPVIARNDDLRVAARVGDRSFSDEYDAGMVMNLVYDTHVIEGHRSEFGFPGL